MKVTDLANEIWIENGSSSDTSIPAIAYFIRSQLGKINVLLFEDFVIEETSGQYEILDGTEEISIDAASIIKKIYEISQLDFNIRAQMNAQAADSVLEFKEADGSSFKRVNRNESSKVYASLKKDELQSLKDLVTAYRIKKSVPLDVVGTDCDNLTLANYSTYGRVGYSRY